MSDIQLLGTAVTTLVNGWYERTEYKVRVTAHLDGCKRSLPCLCPEHVEDRVKNARHVALLVQLRQASCMPTSGGGGGSSGNKPQSRPPGNTAPADLIDSIKEQSWEQYVKLCQQVHGTTPSYLARAPIHQILHNLVQVSMGAQDEYRDAVKGAASAGRQWVRKARILLGYDRPTIMLADTVCGDCGGALSVASDASTDVRCVGSPVAPSCGRVYPRWQWMDLLRGQEW